MRRPFRHALAATFAASSLVLVGCGVETTTPTNIQGTSAGPTTQPSPAEPTQKPDTGVAKKVDEAGNPVVPTEAKASDVNPAKQLSAVEEAAKAVPAETAKPTDIYWQRAASKPEDEPLEITPPLGLNPLTPVAVVPAANPMTKGRVELGKLLYFDPRLSKDSTVSCATCHNPEKGWTDQMPVSAGINGQLGGRSSPTVLNTAYNRIQFWDGRAATLEAQAQGPVKNPIEMGDQTYEEIVNRLREIPDYRTRFKKVFGTDVTLDGVAKAIAAFERTALTGNSPYDRYAAGNDYMALNESQKRGMLLFGLRLSDDDPDKEKVEKAATLQKAACSACHAGSNFTDDQFHNLGVGWDASKMEFADVGRWAISPIGAKRDEELGQFKTPTLRNLSSTAPYMHNGSEKTIEAVIDFYDRGGNPNPYLDPDIKKLGLTAQERADLVAFMKALDGEAPKVEVPALPPGPDGKAPDARAALTPPTKKTALTDPHRLVR